MKRRTKALRFSRQTMDKIKERDNARCIFCGKAGNDFMHYVSRASGGLGVEQNGAVGCRDCHTKLDNSEYRQPMLMHFDLYLSGKYDDWDINKLIYRKG